MDVQELIATCAAIQGKDWNAIADLDAGLFQELTTVCDRYVHDVTTWQAFLGSGTFHLVYVLMFFGAVLALFAFLRKWGPSRRAMFEGQVSMDAGRGWLRTRPPEQWNPEMLTVFQALCIASGLKQLGVLVMLSALLLAVIQ